MGKYEDGRIGACIQMKPENPLNSIPAARGGHLYLTVTITGLSGDMTVSNSASGVKTKYCFLSKPQKLETNLIPLRNLLTKRIVPERLY